jgi:hypothetical protein
VVVSASMESIVQSWEEKRFEAGALLGAKYRDIEHDCCKISVSLTRCKTHEREGLKTLTWFRNDEPETVFKAAASQRSSTEPASNAKQRVGPSVGAATLVKQYLHVAEPGKEGVENMATQTWK